MTYEDLLKMGFLSKDRRRNNCVTSWSSKQRPSSSPSDGLPTITANLGRVEEMEYKLRGLGLLKGRFLSMDQSRIDCVTDQSREQGQLFPLE